MNPELLISTRTRSTPFTSRVESCDVKAYTVYNHMLLPTTFSSVEDPFYIKCDVHPWMKAWVMVADHPYFAVTDENGNFEINNVLPPGEYELGFWHERLSNLPKKKFIQVDHTITFSITESATDSGTGAAVEANKAGRQYQNIFAPSNLESQVDSTGSSD